ncbi:MAG: glycosyltransferase family 4 protein [Nanoarchaeota archaeon]
MNKKILFVTRKYPPQIGGMQQYSYDFYTTMCTKSEIKLLKGNTISIFPKFMFFFILNKNKYQYIHFADSSLALLTYFIKLFNPSVKTSVTAHGLDIVYKNKFYQKILKFSLKYTDKIICVSNYTFNECCKLQVSKEKCYIIHNGITNQQIQDLKELELSNKFKEPNEELILISIGRQVERKGTRWFVDNVMPKLDKKIKYIIIGDGPEISNIENSIKKNKLQQQIKLFKKVSNKQRDQLCKKADLFIMPNIKIPNNPEGFGLVILEANMKNLIPIGTSIDGITDAIKENKNGHLCREKSIEDFKNHINFYNNNLKVLKTNQINFKKYAIENYSWEDLANQYIKKIFNK